VVWGELLGGAKSPTLRRFVFWARELIGYRRYRADRGADIALDALIEAELD
jgi:hypothetical protein